MVGLKLANRYIQVNWAKMDVEEGLDYDLSGIGLNTRNNSKNWQLKAYKDPSSSNKSDDLVRFQNLADGTIPMHFPKERSLISGL